MQGYVSERAWFKAQLNNQTLLHSLRAIKLVICDVDGSLTDANIYLHQDGQEIKGYSVQDGFGITRAQSAGLHIGLVTGKSSPIIVQRARQLGIPESCTVLGMDIDKRQAIAHLQKNVGITPEATAIFGDDVLDINARDRAALFVAPTNALFYVQSGADIIVPRAGGNGALRMLLDLILFVQGKHFSSELIEAALTREP